MSKKIGFTLGKFAPLHRGHQYLIETALKECDELWIMVYEFPEYNVPLSKRIHWIKTLYPTVNIIEALDGPLEVGYTPEIKKMHEDYIQKKLNGKKVDIFFCSEPYGEHISQSLQCQKRIVDIDRKVFPISATEIRKNPYQNRQYLEPIVYKDLVANIVFLGAPATGKTTLCEALSKEFSTEWMPEYGREYWETHQIDRRLTSNQLLEIAMGHLEREDKLLEKANRFLFTDTNAITTLMFAYYYHGAALDTLETLAKESVARYDVFFVCDADIPYDDTWDRSGEANRTEMQIMNTNYLQRNEIPYYLLSGSLAERMNKVKAILQTLS